jgi:glycosyltransferase involved in cell wall biosynthesis
VITTIERGGAENQLVVLVEEQLKNGLKVEVVPLKGRTDLLQTLESVGCTVNTSILNNPAFKQVFFLRKIFAKYNDRNFVVHAHLPRAEFLTSFHAKKFSLVVSRHNCEAFFPKVPQIISQSLSRFSSRNIKACIAISEAVKHYLIKAKEIHTPTMIKVIYYGYKSSNFSDSIPVDLHKLFPDFDTHAVTIGTISRLTQQKDIPTLLKGFALAFNSHHRRVAQLLVVGEGVLRLKLEALANELGIQNKVFWAGKRQDIHSFLNLMDVFVLSSRYEGFGLVLLEALDHGLPIVASNNSAIPEVLGREHPFLFKTGDTKDLSLKLQEAANQIGYSSCKYKERLDMFHPSIMENKIRNIYHSILGI